MHEWVNKQEHYSLKESERKSTSGIMKRNYLTATDWVRMVVKRPDTHCPSTEHPRRSSWPIGQQHPPLYEFLALHPEPKGAPEGIALPVRVVEGDSAAAKLEPEAHQLEEYRVEQVLERPNNLGEAGGSAFAEREPSSLVVGDLEKRPAGEGIEGNSPVGEDSNHPAREPSQRST
jgi:hypothetical protein